MDIHYGDGVNLLQIKQKVDCKIEHAQFDISHTISFAHCSVDLCDFGGTIQGPRLGVAPPFTKGFLQSLATTQATNGLDYPLAAYQKYGIRSYTPGNIYGWLRDNVVGVFLNTNGTPGQYIDGVVYVPPQPDKPIDFDIVPDPNKSYGFPQLNDIYALRFKIWPTSGYFQLAFATAPGNTNVATKYDMEGNILTCSTYKTDPISFDASAQDILDALTPGLTSDFTVDVTGGPLPENPIFIELTGTYVFATFDATFPDGVVLRGLYPDGSLNLGSQVKVSRQGLSGLMCVYPLDASYTEQPGDTDDTGTTNDGGGPETINDGDDYTQVKPLPIMQLVQMFCPKIAASGLTYYKGTYDHFIVNGTSYSAVTWIKQWQLSKYLTQIFDHFDVRVLSNIFDWLVQLNATHDWGYDMTSFLVQGDLATEVVHYENQDSQTYVASGEPWNVFYYLRAIRNFLETVSQDKFGMSYEYCPLWARYNKNNFLLANTAMTQAGFTWSYDYAMIYALAGDWTWTTPNIEDLGNYGKYSVDDVTSVLPNAIIQPAAPAPNSQQLVGNLLQYLGTTTWRALNYTYVVSTASVGANTVPPWFDLDQVLPQMNAVSYNGFSHNLTYPFYTMTRTKIVQATKHAFQKQWSTPGDVVWLMNAGSFKGLPVGTMVTLGCYKWDGVVPTVGDYSTHIHMKLSTPHEATSIGAGDISSMIAEICDFPQSCTLVTCGTDPNGLDDIYVFQSPPYNATPPTPGWWGQYLSSYGLSPQSSPWGTYPNENRFYVLGIFPARQDVSNLTWAEVKDLPDTGNNSVTPNWQNDAGRITNPDPWTALKYSSYTYTSNYLSPYTNGANIYQGTSYALAAGFGCAWFDPSWDGNSWYSYDGVSTYPMWSADYQGEHGGCYLDRGSLTINYSESTTAYLIDTGGLTIRQFLGAQFKDYLIERLTHVGTKTNNYSATSGAMYNGPPAIFDSQYSYSATLFYPMRGTNGNAYGWYTQGLIDTTNLQNQYATVQPSKYKAHCTVKCGFISGSLRSVVGIYTQQATYPTYHYDPISQTYVYGYVYFNSYRPTHRPADETMMDAIVADTGATIFDLQFTESTFKQPSDPDNQWYATRNNSALNTQGVNGFQQFGYSYQVYNGFGYNVVNYSVTFPRKMTYDEREVNVAAAQISDLDPQGKNLFYISFEYKIDDMELDSVSALAAKMNQTIFCNGEVMVTDCTLNNTLVSPVNLTSSMGKGVTGNSSATLMGYNKNDVYGVVNSNFPQDVSDVPKLLVGPLRLELENDIYTVEGQAIG